MPSVPEDVVYGIGRIDASGRIADRAVISALGWSGGDRLTPTADAGVVTARRDTGGMVTLPGRAYIAIPAALRRRCGLRPGDQVLPGHSRGMKSVAVGERHGRPVIISGGGKTVQVWDLQAEREAILQIELPHRALSVASSADQLVTGTTTELLRIDLL
ncbi:MAG: hypothetical protein ABSA02_40320 [Trebonia sp.]